MTPRFLSLLLALNMLLLSTAAPAIDTSKKSKPRPALSTRPVLEFRQGQYFRWSTPKGWASQETTNGVDLIAPGGKTFVSSALLFGGFGRMTPRQFLTMTLRQVNPTAQIVSARVLPAQPGLMGAWKIEDFGIAATANGTPVRMQATVAVNEAYGRYSATMMLYQAPATTWTRDKTWLPAIALSIVVTNPRQVAGQDRVMLPRNNPLDNSGLIESWRRKGLSEDRISQARQEATMGYERMQDPQTGQHYNVPLEYYDGTVGGYRNPMRPTELLQKTPPSR